MYNWVKAQFTPLLISQKKMFQIDLGFADFMICKDCVAAKGWVYG